MHDHTESYLLFAFAVVAFAGFLVTGYIPPENSEMAHTMSSNLYGIALAAVGAFFRALGVNGNSKSNPKDERSSLGLGQELN